MKLVIYIIQRAPGDRRGFNNQTSLVAPGVRQPARHLFYAFSVGSL